MGKHLIVSLIAAVTVLTGCSTSKQSISGHDPANIGQSAFQSKLEIRKTVEQKYLVWVPQNYSTETSKQFPTILFLHGAGERGTNIWRATTHGPSKYIQNHPEFPFIVITPQCPEGQTWSSDTLMALLAQVEKDYRVDTNRVYLTGLSMGGYGSWNLGLTHPETFAAMAPICGGGNSLTPVLLKHGYCGAEQKKQLQTLGIWAFHGAKDPVVPKEESERMVTMLKQAGVQEVKLTMHPEAQHNAWAETYNNPELYRWFLEYHR